MAPLLFSHCALLAFTWHSQSGAGPVSARLSSPFKLKSLDKMPSYIACIHKNFKSLAEIQYGMARIIN